MEEGPAAVLEDGTELWYQHDKLHRIGGPAVIFPDGTKLWYKVVVQSCGTKLWYKDDKLHGEDGPAIDDINSKRWYLNGQEVKGERLSRMMIKLRAKRMKSARS